MDKDDKSHGLPESTLYFVNCFRSIASRKLVAHASNCFSSGHSRIYGPFALSLCANSTSSQPTGRDPYLPSEGGTDASQTEVEDFRPDRQQLPRDGQE